MATKRDSQVLMQLFSMFQRWKWPQWQEAATLIHRCCCRVCCAASIMSPSTITMFLLSSHPFSYQPVLAVTHQFSALISRFSASRLFSLLFSSEAEMFFSSASYMWRRQYAVSLRNNTPLKCILVGCQPRCRGWFLWSCWWVLTPSGLVGFCSHTWPYHAAQWNVSGLELYCICVWDCGQYF